MSKEDSDERTFDEMIAGLTSAMPSMAVTIWRDHGVGCQFRATLTSKPSPADVSGATVCCEVPSDAVATLHATYVKQARQRCAMEEDNVARLMTRIIPKPKLCAEGSSSEA